MSPRSRPEPGIRAPLASTAAGTRLDAFGPSEWTLLLSIALIWGASFFFIEIGLEAFAPGVVAFARIALGAATLAAFPRARRPVDRADLPRVALLGIVWMGVPLTLFPLAQQHIASSVAGMINGATPLATAVVAAVLLRRMPGRWQVAGLAIGFLGVIAISLPNVSGADAAPHGVVLVLLAVVLYGFAFNLAVPLQQRYGALPVLLRAQLVAAVAVAPFAAVGIPDSTWSWTSAAAMLALGAVGTGLAFAAMTSLVGRVGGPRGSVSVYLVPVVAILLGVVVLGEHVAPLALVGTALVILGAWLTSRRESSAPLAHPTGGATATPGDRID
jgi:drug/metabolite transporter (DMT)-like permease